MIAPNELRLNNLFSHQGKIKKVFSISQTGVFGTDIENGHSASSCTSQEIEPINITEEWLAELEFSEWKLGEYGVFCFRNPIYVLQEFKGNKLCVAIGNPKIGMPAIPSIKYVHQLQNLYFTLTGEELEIKNPH